ncbi:methyltransferase domain-containing protein [Candidatus Woesearchaeota archaeon]|nr:methyltransferase domain-containing protein [Candidatus Woesearchaeota archaeon]
MEEYKAETKRTYDKYAQDYAERKQAYLQKYLLNDITLFIKQLKGKRVLDIGSGPGRDAAYLKEKGLQVVCIDISPTQVELCKKKGLEAYEMDFEHLTFEKRSFDGVWAYTSLLHVPKNRFDVVLCQIRDVLNKNGVVYIGMKEGTFEGFREDAHYPGHKRYVAWYTEEELKEKLMKYFMIVRVSRVEIDEEHKYVNVLCKVK